MTHYALVIGIDDYSAAFRPLQGACGDAASFYDWLRDADGGNVPPENIAFFTNQPRPASANPPRAASVAPTWSSIRSALAEWIARAQQTQQPVGSRLYIYLAGHGYNHRDHMDDVYLLLQVYADLCADAFPGTGSGEWFRVRAMFDEILLLMDCCRDREVSVEPTSLALGGTGAIGGREPAMVRILFSYGAEYGRASRERSFDGNGRPQGVFTKALIEGLRGAACDGTGAVSCSSLMRYLTARVPQLAPAEYPYRDPQRPTFSPSVVPPGQDFVICTPAAATRLAPALPVLRVGMPEPFDEVVVWDGTSFNSATRSYLRSVSVDWEKQAGEWAGHVAPGLYVLEWSGQGTTPQHRAVLVEGDCHASL